MGCTACWRPRNWKRSCGAGVTPFRSKQAAASWSRQRRKRAVRTTSLLFWCGKVRSPYERQVHLPKLLLPVALVVALSCPATAQVAILQILVVEGEGAVHGPGARSTRPMTVEVT